MKLPKAELMVASDLLELQKGHIRRRAGERRPLRILEAGCGKRWRLKLDDVQYRLVGLDISQDALELRKSQFDDLDEAIVGDLRTAGLREGEFDIVYSCYVLEHIEGAELVLDNFFRWLKPGGLLILTIPDRDSARGFATRITPHLAHILFYRYIKGWKNAGKSGHGPFPTVFDKIVSRRGIREYCEAHDAVILDEYGIDSSTGTGFERWTIKALSVLSFGMLESRYCDLTYVIQKNSKRASEEEL